PGFGAVFYNTYGKSYRRTAGRIESLRMVALFHAYLVFFQVRHHPGQVFVKLKKNIYAQAEIRSINKCTFLPMAEIHGFVVIIKPCGSAGDNGHTIFQTGSYISESGGRNTEIYGNIGTGNVLCSKFIINFRY